MPWETCPFCLETHPFCLKVPPETCPFCLETYPFCLDIHPFWWQIQAPDRGDARAARGPRAAGAGGGALRSGQVHGGSQEHRAGGEEHPPHDGGPGALERGLMN
eukprot:103721-Prorocentrum_minimum.AAC.1